jgi:hypothetical protein
VFDPRGVAEYAEFKESTFWDAAEDAWSIESPLGALRGNIRDFIPLPSLSESEAHSIARAVLLDLLDEGRICFLSFRGGSLTAAAIDPALRISAEDARQMLETDESFIEAARAGVHFTALEAYQPT